MTPVALDPNLRNRLTRFLHIGTEIPRYSPGCWRAQKKFEAGKLKAIDEALDKGVNHYEIINIIVKAYKDGWCTRFETIAFALTKCLVVGSSDVKEAAYNAAAEICGNSEEMLLFNKFTRILQTGNGQGWCKHVREWYTSRNPMELALEMSRVRGRYGRSHRTLLRKSHMKLAQNDARNAVVKYAIFGLRRAKQMVGEREDTKPIFEYLQKVEDIRVCECMETAARIIEANKFTLDYVPAHFLTSQQVWNAVLPQLTLSELLYNIQRIHNMGFLTADSMTTSIVLSLLSNEDIIKKSKVTPIEVYITLCDYKKKSRPMKYEKAKIDQMKQMRRRTRQVYDPKTDQWEWNVTKHHPKELKYWGVEHPPNTEVLNALSQLIDQTWCLTPPTNARYLITLDMRHHMFKGRHFCKSMHVPRKSKKAVAKTTPSVSVEPAENKDSKKHLYAECFYNKHVTPGHAAIILALQIMKRERDAKLAVFTEEGIQLITIERNFGNIEEAEFVLRKANLGRVQLDAPIRWATENKQKFDVFINMVDRQSRYMELDISDRVGRGQAGRYGPPPTSEELEDRCPVRALEKYRATGVHNAKMILMSLATHRVASTDGSHEGVLDIVGIDAHVPNVMDAFVLNHFN